MKQRIPKIIINLLCLTSLVAIIHFTPMAFGKFSEKTGYFQETEKTEYVNDKSRDQIDKGVEEDVTQTDKLMAITADTANIRSGPNKDSDVLTTAKKGTVFVTTGNQKTASNGRIWYEIYLDEEKSLTGWASQAVIEYKE